MRRGFDPGDNVDRVIARARKPTPIHVTPWLVAVYLAAALVIGCDRPAEAPVDQGTASLVEDDVSEHLRALGYVAWDEDADQNLSGAIVHDASAVAPGANLYTNDEDTVLLMDEQGSVLRSWELPGRMHCEHAELLSSGRLAVLCEREALVILERETLEPVWHWGEGVLELPHDPTWLPDGHLLVLDNGTRRGYSRVLEVDPEIGEIVWRYPAEHSQSLHSEWRGNSQRSPGGNTLICESERGHVLEVTPEGRVVWEFWNPELGDRGRKRIYRFTRLAPDRAASLTGVEVQ